MLRYGGIWINSKGIEKNKKGKGKGKTQQSSQFYFMKKNPFFKKKRESKASKAIKGLKLN